MGLVIKEAKEEPEKSLIPFLHVFLVFFPKERVKAEATSASYFSVSSTNFEIREEEERISSESKKNTNSPLPRDKSLFLHSPIPLFFNLNPMISQGIGRDDGERGIATSIIKNDNLQFFIILTYDAVQSLFKILFGVIYRNKDGNQGLHFLDLVIFITALLILEKRIVKAGRKRRVDTIQPRSVTAIKRPKYLMGV